MLTCALDITDAVRSIDALQAALARQMPQLLGNIGRSMAEHAREDFLTKALGGRGDDGVTWPALTPAEAQRKQRQNRPMIGIRTGQLAVSFRYTIGGETAWGKHLAPGEVVIENVDQPKANFFNAQRRLFPERLPNTWYREADALTQAAVDAAAASVFPA